MDVGIDSEMKAERSAAEPHAASHGEVRGLRLLNQSKHVAVEGSRGRFVSGGHRELHVIEAEDFKHECTRCKWRVYDSSQEAACQRSGSS